MGFISFLVKPAYSALVALVPDLGPFLHRVDVSVARWKADELASRLTAPPPPPPLPASPRPGRGDSGDGSSVSSARSGPWAVPRPGDGGYSAQQRRSFDVRASSDTKRSVSLAGGSSCSSSMGTTPEEEDAGSSLPRGASRDRGHFAASRLSQELAPAAAAAEAAAARARRDEAARTS